MFGRKTNSAVANLSSRRKSSARASTALRIEQLEAREMMTVNYYGGGVLPHVKVQGLYLGKDWYTSANYQTTGNLELFMKTVVNSPYMDMLTCAGYGVGRGSFDQGRLDLVDINKGYYLTDTSIRQQLQAFVSAGYLTAPDSNRLFVVYVEPGVAIMNDHDGNSTSIKDFLGYHGAFAGRDYYGRGADFHYAVIAYPGGINYSSNIFPNSFAQLTSVTSHELAEAVTDPNVNYKTLGWYDPHRGEIGDIVNGQTFIMNGYVVQKESDRFDRAMTTSGVSGAATYASSTYYARATSSLHSETFGAAEHLLSHQGDVSQGESHRESNHAYATHVNLMVGQIQPESHVRLTSVDSVISHGSIPHALAEGIHAGVLDYLFGSLPGAV